MLLLFFSGFYFFEYLITIGLLLSFLICLKSKSLIKKETSKSLLVLLLSLISISELFAPLFLSIGYELKVSIANILLICVAYLFSLKLEREKFEEYYILLLVLIAFCSNIAYFLTVSSSSFITHFPALVNSNARTGYFGIFFIASDFASSGTPRNQGIFWEPGAFQVFLYIAYVLEMFPRSGREPRKWVLILILITIFTTISTTGIFVALLLFFYSLYKRRLIKSKWIIIPIAFAVVYAIYKIYPLLEGFWKYTLIDKTQMAIDYQVGDDSDASTRVNSIIYPLKLYLKSPIVGIGSSGLNYLDDVTCTIVNMFVQYGIIYGILLFSSLWSYFKSLTHSLFDTVIIICLFIFSSSTEAIELNVIILMMVFWGWNDKNNKRKKAHFEYENCCN